MCLFLINLFHFFQEAHPDYSDVQKANLAFKNLVVCHISLIEPWPES